MREQTFYLLVTRRVQQMLVHFQLFFCDLSHLCVHLTKRKKPSAISKERNEQIQMLTPICCANLVDPKDHRVLQIKRQLLGGTEV